MTLDLGFAHLRFDDGIEAGIVDVPGHERFLHNMLAGAAGMELLLLVIAADDGVMPQTLEHLQILQYLNVKKIVVALTKIDLVPPQEQGLACQRVHAQLADTIARDAFIFAVSTVSGANLEVLKEGLHQELAALPVRDPNAPAYLPIDRVFALTGRGTIVTGTLMQGRIAVGDTVALQPLGAHARVRSLHVFGNAREAATGGTRVALNLPGIERTQIARGAVVADSAFSARNQLSVRFAALPDAVALLRRRTHVRAYVGSAEVLGTLSLIAFRPAWMRFTQRCTCANRCSRFRVYASSCAVSHQRPCSAAARSSRSRAKTPTSSPRKRMARSPHCWRRAASSRKRSRRLPLRQTFARKLRNTQSTRLPNRARGRGRASDCVRRRLGIRAVRCARSEGTRNLTRGAALGDGCHVAHSRAQLGIAEPQLLRLLMALANEGRIALRQGYYSTTEHQPKLSSEQRAFFEEHVPFDAATPFLPVSLDGVTEQLRLSAIPGLTRAFETLLARGVLVKVGDALYLGAQIERAHERVDAFITANNKMTMAEFRDLLGTSRKYAVPLLEWFDARGITVPAATTACCGCEKARASNPYKLVGVIDLIRLPKAELHLHIEGTFEPELIFTIAARNGREPGYPSLEALRAAYLFSDLQSFLNIYYAGMRVVHGARLLRFGVSLSRTRRGARRAARGDLLRSAGPYRSRCRIRRGA